MNTMASIEAEMARFEEEIGREGPIPDLPPPPMFLPRNQNSNFEGRMRPGNNIGPDNQGFCGGPPPDPGYNNMPGPGPMPGMLMQNNDHMFGPGPMMNNDQMMGPGGPMNNMPGPGQMMGQGPGPFLGPGPMVIGPGIPPGMNSSEISAPPVITSAPKVYSAAPVIMKPPQILKRKLQDDFEDTANASLNPMMPQLDMNLSKTATGSSTLPATNPNLPKPRSNMQPPPQFSQAAAASAPYVHGARNQGKKKKCVRTAAGQTWEDQTLLDWDPNDYRLFCGDLGNEVTDDMLARVFNKYNSFQRARVVRDKNSKKTKGYGFVSFKDPNDFIRAMREMNGKYVGNRPIKLRKSNWKDRNVDVVKKKLKEKKKLGYKV